MEIVRLSYNQHATDLEFEDLHPETNSSIRPSHHTVYAGLDVSQACTEMEQNGQGRMSKLNIIIVGAGLGGLAAALALRQQGHEITVLEVAAELVTAGAGIQIPPPSTRILKSWGLEDKFRDVISVPKTFAFRSYRDGCLLGAIPLNPFCQERYGSQWWTVHRADYQKILFDPVIQMGVKVKLNRRVVDVDPEVPYVTVVSGHHREQLTADLVIGADGLRSSIRAGILGDQDPGPRSSSICAYRALVPLEAMHADELRRPLMDVDNPNVDVWLGPEHMMLSYPLRQDDRAQYNLVLVHPEKDEHTKHDLPSRFPRPSSIPEVAAHYANFCQQVRSIVSVVTPEDENDFWIRQSGLNAKDGILEWKLADLDELPTWCSKSGKVVLLGDAAHAQRPYMSAGASCAVEDAVALATLLNSQMTQKHGLSKLVHAYMNMRKARVTEIRRMSAADSITWGLPDGDGQKKRDAFLACLGATDRQICADAMADMKAAGIGEFNFGDSQVMDWAWGYDVAEHAKQVLTELT